jgi:hypothetical protein
MKALRLATVLAVLAILAMALAQFSASAAVATDPVSGTPAVTVLQASTLHVDSRVNDNINVYANGMFIGRMGPFGDLYVGCYSAEILSARGDSGRTWGPAYVNACPFTWTLVP